MIHKFLLALALSLSLALTPALAHASGDGGDGAGGEDPFASVQQRAAVVLTVIVMTTVFEQTVRAMTVLNFANILQNQQARLIQGGPDGLSAINQLFVANQVAFVATVILMLAVLRGARWQKAQFTPPQATRAYSMGLVMMMFAAVALLLLPYSMMNRYGRHGVTAMR
jgi:hypothetical protein